MNDLIIDEENLAEFVFLVSSFLIFPTKQFLCISHEFKCYYLSNICIYQIQ